MYCVHNKLTIYTILPLNAQNEVLPSFVHLIYIHTEHYNILDDKKVYTFIV